MHFAHQLKLFQLRFLNFRLLCNESFAPRIHILWILIDLCLRINFRRCVYIFRLVLSLVSQYLILSCWELANIYLRQWKQLLSCFVGFREALTHHAPHTEWQHLHFHLATNQIVTVNNLLLLISAIGYSWCLGKCNERLAINIRFSISFLVYLRFLKVIYSWLRYLDQRWPHNWVRAL